MIGLLALTLFAIAADYGLGQKTLLPDSKLNKALA
jgi:hypothetical protein